MEFVKTNPRVVSYTKKSQNILKRLNRSLEKEDLKDVKELIEELEISCPESGSKEWTDVKQFNLMFDTKLGASKDSVVLSSPRNGTRNFFVNFQMFKNQQAESSFWNPNR